MCSMLIILSHTQTHCVCFFYYLSKAAHCGFIFVHLMNNDDDVDDNGGFWFAFVHSRNFHLLLNYALINQIEIDNLSKWIFNKNIYTFFVLDRAVRFVYMRLLTLLGIYANYFEASFHTSYFASTCDSFLHVHSINSLLSCANEM